MSGHSKWATTKHKKAAIDAKRGKLFAKLIKNIEIAARLGGGDPDGNPTLYDAIVKAKKASMPADNIKRAVKRGSGEEAGGANYEEIVYEGYAPAGVGLIIECLTDNRNRAAADVRSTLSKGGGSLATTGSVSFNFERKGQIMVPKEVETGDKKNPVKPNGAAADEEEFMLAVAEAGGDDYEEAEGEWIIYTGPQGPAGGRHRLRLRRSRAEPEERGRAEPRGRPQGLQAHRQPGRPGRRAEHLQQLDRLRRGHGPARRGVIRT